MSTALPSDAYSEHDCEQSKFVKLIVLDRIAAWSLTDSNAPNEIALVVEKRFHSPLRYPLVLPEIIRAKISEQVFAPLLVVRPASANVRQIQVRQPVVSRRLKPGLLRLDEPQTEKSTVVFVTVLDKPAPRATLRDFDGLSLSVKVVSLDCQPALEYVYSRWPRRTSLHL